jgi:murein DD-endopeptidase MepM/ murein hydrolase activator NlpD
MFVPVRQWSSVAVLVAGIVVVRTPVSAVGIERAVRAGPGVSAPAYGTYEWPVRGEVIRSFEPPSSEYGPGHRGIDIAAPVGSVVRSAGAGWVAFAGWVAGSLYVSVEHPDGIRTTYSWLSGISVRTGDAVERGQAIGLTGPGHPGIQPSHLHFGARVGEVYIDPMLLLGGGSVVGLIHLAPLDPSSAFVASRILSPAARESPLSGGFLAANPR